MCIRSLYKSNTYCEQYILCVLYYKICVRDTNYDNNPRHVNTFKCLTLRFHVLSVFTLTLLPLQPSEGRVSPHPTSRTRSPVLDDLKVQDREANLRGENLQQRMNSYYVYSVRLNGKYLHVQTVCKGFEPGKSWKQEEKTYVQTCVHAFSPPIFSCHLIQGLVCDCVHTMVMYIVQFNFLLLQ